MRNDINKTINASNTLKSDIQFLGNKKESNICPKKLQKSNIEP